MTIEQLGLVIAKRRESLSLKQVDIAEMAGLSIKTIYMVETGKGNPSVLTLAKVLDILGLEFITRIKQMNEENEGAGLQ